MLLYGENKDYFTWQYDFEIDSKDVEELIPILKEHLSKNHNFVNFSDNDFLDFSNRGLSISTLRNDSVIYMHKDGNCDEKTKKFLKRKLRTKYKDYKFEGWILSFEKTYYFSQKLIQLLKSHYSEEYLAKICELDIYKQQYINQNKGPISCFSLEEYFSYFIKSSNINLEKFINICESLNHDSTLLDAFLDSYPDIRILRQMAPYLKLIPKYKRGIGLIEKEIFNIAKKSCEGYEPSVRRKLNIAYYEETIQTKRLLDALNIKFKSIELNEKEKKEITEKQKAESVRKIKELESEYGDYVYFIRGVTLINKNRQLDNKKELGEAFLAELEKSKNIPNSIKIKIFKAMIDKEFYEKYKDVFVYFDFFENHEWYQKQMSVHYKELYPLLERLDDRNNRRRDEGIEFPDEEKYNDLFDVNTKATNEERVEMYKNIIESQELNQSQELTELVENNESLQQTGKRLIKKPNNKNQQ